MQDSYDLIVIGGGPAGEKGAAQAAYFGHSVLVVDAGNEPGGAAVHTGTLPSKTLRETALYLSGHRARDLYGVSMELDPHATVPKLIARKDAIAAAESARIRRNFARHHIELVQGYARFAGPNQIEIEAPDGTVRSVSAKFVLIATGSIPRNPDEVPIADLEVYDSDEILGIDRLPATLAVLGAGVIGCEYACMFAALGVKVILLEPRDRALSFLDFEIGDRLIAAMQRLGIEIRLGQRWEKVTHEKGRGIVTEIPGHEPLVTDKLLFTAGRVGNTKRLELARAGLSADPRGILSVDEHYRTSVAHVYAVGDVIGFPALASTSMEQARVAVCHAFDIEYKRSMGPALPYGIYTIPEVSCIGESEESAKAHKLDYVVGSARFDENARGLIAGDTDGMTKILVHRATRRLIGVHVIGERATELIHVGQAVMHLGGTVDAFIEMVFNYPTLSESFKYAAYSALGQLSQ